MADDKTDLSKYLPIILPLLPVIGAGAGYGVGSMSFNDEIALCLPLIQNELKHSESACRDRIQDVNAECALIILKTAICD